MRRVSLLAAIALAIAPALAPAGCSARPGAPALALDESKIVDLTHPFDEHTVFWPTARPFHLTSVAAGRTAGGYWYASNEYCASEQGGTHLDAPVHFAEGRSATDEIPIARLVGPARVIDVSAACALDRDYLVTPADIAAHEARHGPIELGSIVLIRTGFGRFYPDLERYLGTAQRGTAEGLSFPGIGADAARALVARRIDMVGLDTASLDHGPSTDFIAHRILNGADVPSLENVANLDRLPPRGALVIALPMKIAGGSGGPCRIIAILP